MDIEMEGESFLSRSTSSAQGLRVTTQLTQGRVWTPEIASTIPDNGMYIRKYHSFDR